MSIVIVVYELLIERALGTPSFGRKGDSLSFDSVLFTTVAGILVLNSHQYRGSRTAGAVTTATVPPLAPFMP
jgi:hypothetical protein